MNPTRLTDLLSGIDVVSVSPTVGETMIAGVTQHSALVEPRWLFCCRRGATTDGHDHAPEALRRGASALLVETPQRLPVAQVVVRDVNRSLPAVAAAFWGHPSRRLELIGVTGTNGKTTTTYLIRDILERHGWPTGVIGTLSGRLTTPEPTELHRRLAELVATGHRAAAMEVSSHGLVQRRVDATRFAVSVFTNLDRDHLDYHGDMESYFAAKALLFAGTRTKIGVVNRDDPWGTRLQAESTTRFVGYTIEDTRPVSSDIAGSVFHWRGQEVRLRLPGRFNVSNALAAATAAESLGVPTTTIAEALSVASGPPGRMELIDAGQPYRVVVDCAHTPSALEQVLGTFQTTGEEKLIVVFGCGGDRDRSKRPQMGAAVARHADIGILTADNPRNELLHDIFDDVLVGTGSSSLTVEPDRRIAIARAIDMAKPGDTVLIAGKGDQTVQQIESVALAFDDRQVAREEIIARRPGRALSRHG